MKKNIFLGFFLVLAVFGGLLLSSCDIEATESGQGTIKIVNNSNNVRITYISVERGSTKVQTSNPGLSINPGGSITTNSLTTGSYSVYIEDNYGDGWLTISNVTVRKDQSVEVRFPNDFKPSN